MRKTFTLNFIALATVAAFTALGIGTAQAQQFARANISIEKTGEAAGGLTCSWRETGLGAYSQISYSCGATDLGVLSQCFYKNKPVGNSTPTLSVFHNVTSNEEGGGGEEGGFIANNSGAINGSLTVEVPESEGGGGEACAEPAEEVVTAVRWCNASLADTTNNITGASVAELFLQLERNATGTIPSCAELATMPGSGGGEGGG